MRDSNSVMTPEASDCRTISGKSPDLAELRGIIFSHCVTSYWSTLGLQGDAGRYRQDGASWEHCREFERLNELAVVSHCRSIRNLTEAVLLFGPANADDDPSRPLERVRRPVAALYDEHLFIACPAEDHSDSEEGQSSDSANGIVMQLVVVPIGSVYRNDGRPLL